jgi:hypothetical protein
VAPRDSGDRTREPLDPSTARGPERKHVRGARCGRDVATGHDPLALEGEDELLETWTFRDDGVGGLAVAASGRGVGDDHDHPGRRRGALDAGDPEPRARSDAALVDDDQVGVVL